MKRLVLNTLTALSLLLCVGTVALWVRSYYVADTRTYIDEHGRRVTFHSKNGRFWSDTFERGGPNSLGGTRIIWTSYAYSSVALLFTLPPAAWLLWRRFAGGSSSPGICRECGYDLRASRERCPECGVATDGAPMSTDKMR